MNEAALIELIQTQLPQELTAEQIAEIRLKMADSPELQEALLEELLLEQGLATRYAPRITNFAEVIARIEELAAARQRKHWLMWTLAGAFSLALLAGAITLLVVSSRRDRPSEPVVAGGGAASDDAGGRAGGERPGGAAATRPGAAAGRPAGGGSHKAGTQPPQEAPQPAEPVAAAGPMAWDEYVHPSMDRELRWRGQVDALFVGRHGRKAGWSSDRKTCQMQGTFRLAKLPAPGRLLRLGVYHAEKCDLELWSGNEGVRISLQDRQGTIEAQTLRRKRRGSSPTVTGTVDDRGAWRWYRLGAVDVRYQDGQILVCRGEIPLVRAPLAKAPTEGALVDARVGLWLAEARPCKPLILPAEPADAASITRMPAQTFGWQMDPKSNPKDRPQFRVEPGGVVALVGSEDRHAGKAWFPLAVAPGAAMDVDLHVREFTARTTGVLVRVSGRELVVWPDSCKGRNVVTADRGSQGQMEQDVRRGWTVGKGFWLRVRCGRDFVAAWVSDDGKRWWRRQYWPDVGSRKEVQIGLVLTDGKPARRIAADDVRIRRFAALDRLVEAHLLAKARSAASQEVLKAEKRSGALAILDKARPKDVAADQWRMACDAVLQAHADRWGVREDALWSLLLAASRRGAETNVEAVLAALGELTEITRPESQELPAALREVFDALGRTCLEADMRDKLQAVLDASYLRPTQIGSPASRYFRDVAAKGLLRLVLLDRMDRAEWESVRREAMRFLFLVWDRQASAAHREDRELSALAQWAFSKAQARLGAAAQADPVDPPEQWMHPLVVHADSKMLNVIGEFLILVHDKSYESACMTITRQTLPNELVPLGQEEDLLESSHFKVREVLRTTPALRRILDERYSQIGMIRLERARRQNDLEMLKSLAAQFYGTRAGFEATHALADRDLGLGSFYAAAGRYHALLAEKDYPRRSEAAAKFRLASALLGQLAGEPIAEEVLLPGGSFSPQEFERMVAKLAAERQRSGVAAEAAAAAAPGPGRGRVRLIPLADVPGDRQGSWREASRPAAFAIDHDRLFAHHGGTLCALDLRSRRCAWSSQSKYYSRRDAPLGAARPLRVGKNLYVRLGVRGRSALACLEAHTGQMLWSQTYDDRVLSDPVLIDSWLYVITAKDALGEALDLYLHRVSPQTGESALSSALLQVRGGSPSIGRPAVVGNGIVFRASGCLVNCDFRGVVRWARRLPFAPPDVLEEMFYDMPLDDLVVWTAGAGTQTTQGDVPSSGTPQPASAEASPCVIFTSPGCPQVICVNVQTADRLWAQMIHSPVRLVGLVADRVIVAEADRIRALDPATGKTQWQRRCPTTHAGLLPAQKDSIAIVRLDQPDARAPNGQSPVRCIQWISARDGSILRQADLDEPSLYHVVRLFTDGRRIFGLSNPQPRPPLAKLFLLQT